MLCEPPELLIELPCELEPILLDELPMLLDEPPMLLRLDPADWLLVLFPLTDEPIELRDSLLVLLRCTFWVLAPLDTFSRVLLDTFSLEPLDTFSLELLEMFSRVPLEMFSRVPLERFSREPLDDLSLIPLEIELRLRLSAILFLPAFPLMIRVGLRSTRWMRDTA